MRKPRKSLGNSCATRQERMYFYENLASSNLGLQRFDEARQIIREAQAKKTG